MKICRVKPTETQSVKVVPNNRRRTVKTEVPNLGVSTTSQIGIIDAVINNTRVQFTVVKTFEGRKSVLSSIRLYDRDKNVIESIVEMIDSINTTTPILDCPVSVRNSLNDFGFPPYYVEIPICIRTGFDKAKFEIYNNNIGLFIGLLIGKIGVTMTFDGECKKVIADPGCYRGVIVSNIDIDSYIDTMRDFNKHSDSYAIAIKFYNALISILRACPSDEALIEEAKLQCQE